MNFTGKQLLVFVLSACALFAQHLDGRRYEEQTSISIGRARPVAEVPASGTPHHPYHIEARHADGTLFYTYDGFNLRTSAGTTWQSELLGKTTAPTVNTQCNYLALTNTAVTPAEADTTLSGEIATNGLARAQATYADASTTLTVPSAATPTVVGGAGGTAQFYFVYAGNQGIFTGPSAASSSATPAATLDTTHYISLSWAVIPGAAAYVVTRSNSNSAPSGSLAGGATQASSGQVSNLNIGCTATTCTVEDTSNTLTAYTVPASNLTNFGKFTLVKTWTATGAQSAQAFGVFTAASSGTMCFEGTFTQVSLNTNDTFQLTETVYF